MCEAVVTLVLVGLSVCSLVPAGTFALTNRGKAELSLPSSFLHSLSDSALQNFWSFPLPVG